MALVETQSSRFFQRNWTGTAFIVEALLLLVFVAGALAVLLNVFAESYEVGTKSQNEARAILAATNAAETFAAAPAEGFFVASEGDFVTNCVVRAEKTSSGTMYHAQIAVYSLEDINVRDEASVTARDLAPISFEDMVPVIELSTSRFLSGEVS